MKRKAQFVIAISHDTCELFGFKQTSNFIVTENFSKNHTIKTEYFKL